MLLRKLLVSALERGYGVGSLRIVLTGGLDAVSVFAASAKLHNAAFCKVAVSRYAKASLDVAHRWCALSGL